LRNHSRHRVGIVVAFFGVLGGVDARGAVAVELLGVVEAAIAEFLFDAATRFLVLALGRRNVVLGAAAGANGSKPRGGVSALHLAACAVVFGLVVVVVVSGHVIASFRRISAA
jgi:hypothetical protein